MVAIFSFPDDARWNGAEQAVQFSVTVGEFEGSVFVPRHVFQTLIGSRPTPEQCVQHYHLNRSGLERVAEAKIRERQLDDDANSGSQAAICAILNAFLRDCPASSMAREHVLRLSLSATVTRGASVR